MHHKDMNSNLDQVSNPLLGINTQGYGEYLNDIFNIGQKDGFKNDSIKGNSNGIEEAVSIYYTKLKISLSTSIDEWKNKTNRLVRKLCDVREEITKLNNINTSLDNVRFMRGFLYTLMGLIFFLGEVEFSKQTIIYAMQMANISIWWQAALVLALASATGLCKLVYERFIEPYYDEREKDAHKGPIRTFFFALTGITVALFMIIAYYRAVIAKLLLLELDEPYSLLSSEHALIMVSVYVVIAVLFLIGSSVLLPVGLKELSNFYKIKKNIRLLEQLSMVEMEKEREMDHCNKKLNDHKHTLDFMNNEKDFNSYLQSEIQFFNTQYHRGYLNGIDELERKEQLQELEKKQEENTLEIEPVFEEVKSQDDFHHLVRNKLDKAAQLN